MARLLRQKEPSYRFGELAIFSNRAKPEDIERAIAIQRVDLERGEHPKKLGEILVKNNILTQYDVNDILEEQRMAYGKKSKLRIDIKQRGGGVVVIYLAGRLDYKKSVIVVKALERLMNKGAINIIINFNKLVYMDSRGLSVFIRYIDETRARGGDIKFCNMKYTRFILDKIGLSAFIHIFNSEVSAEKSFINPIDFYILKGALGEFVSSEDGKFVHLSYCTSAQNICYDSKIFYQTLKDATSSGKRRCMLCKP